MMNNIKTYGDLLEEIESVKKSIKEVKDGFFYEQGDEFDLELYLISLNKMRVANEKNFRLMQKLEIYSCDNCDSPLLDVVQDYDLHLKSYTWTCTCKECGNVQVSKCSKIKLISFKNEVDREFDKGIF